jgi:hypothetical protein
MGKREKKFEEAFTLIEKEKLLIDKKRSLLSFEMAFFFPLFALLFLVSSISKHDTLKLALYIFTIAVMLADIFYSVFLYMEIREKQKKLEKLIENKLQ